MRMLRDASLCRQSIKPFMSQPQTHVRTLGWRKPLSDPTPILQPVKSLSQRQGGPDDGFSPLPRDSFDGGFPFIPSHPREEGIQLGEKLKFHSSQLAPASFPPLIVPSISLVIQSSSLSLTYTSDVQLADS